MPAPRLRYHSPRPLSRSTAERRLASGDASTVAHALVAVALSDPDWQWVQSHCLRLASSSNPEVASIAVTCLGHLARLHRKLDLETVVPLLHSMLKDPALVGFAEDTLDDIRIYMGRKAATLRT